MNTEYSKKIRVVEAERNFRLFEELSRSNYSQENSQFIPELQSETESTFKNPQ